MKKLICLLLSFVMVSTAFSDLSAKDKRKSKKEKNNCSANYISSKLKEEIAASAEFDKNISSEGVVVVKLNVNAANELVVEKIQSNDEELKDLVFKTLNGKKLNSPDCISEDGMIVKFDFRKEKEKLYYQF